jgi:UDP-N-acetylmuramoylalanine--D-glutamate ligase
LTHCIGLQPAAELVVVEVSSFQLDTIASFRPKVAVLLNISEDHQDRYDDMAAYAASKGRIFENMGARDMAVINAADGRIAPLLEGHEIKRAAFGLDARVVSRDPKNQQRAYVSGDTIEIDMEEDRHLAFDTKRCALMGPHNMENIAAACLAALGAGLNPAAIQAAIDDFKGLPHRLERVGTINGVQFINDSKATNVDAVMRALECFATPVVIIMGGRNKGSDFSLLQGHVRRHVASLITIGEAQKEILTALSDACPGQVVTAASMAAALQYGQALARPGQSVLLAPGCASFDMFDSYAHRGDVFRQLVGELA